MKDSQCERGSDPNCRVFAINEDKCRECKNQFYLEKDKCLPHQQIPDCDIYDGLTPQQCIQCVNGYQIFKQKTHCSQVKVVSNCEVYKNRDFCQKCSQGYFLRENECEPIPEESNCVEMSEEGCVRCKENFYLLSGVCTVPVQLELRDCFLKGEIREGYQHCKSCQQNFLPLNFFDHQVCLDLEESLGQYLGTDFETIEGCEVY